MLHLYSVESHSIDTEDLKSLICENETNIIENTEYIKHFLLLVLQSVAMFVVSTFILISLKFYTIFIVNVINYRPFLLLFGEYLAKQMDCTLN